MTISSPGCSWADSRWATPPAFYFEAEQLSKENMQKRLEELYQRTPSAEIIIKADQRLKYGDVKEVMKLAKEAGFQNVGLEPAYMQVMLGRATPDLMQYADAGLQARRDEHLKTR